MKMSNNWKHECMLNVTLGKHVETANLPNCTSSHENRNLSLQNNQNKNSLF